MTGSLDQLRESEGGNHGRRALGITVERTRTPTSDSRLAEILASPGFGDYFTDHMFTLDWTERDGWGSGSVIPYGPLTLDPATAVLHYAQEVFEGLKAYRHPDGSVWSFRPEVNALRMQRSCERLALPELTSADFVAAVDALVRADSRWLPEHDPTSRTSLYVRPFMFASEAFLGVRPSRKVTFMVIASPAGSYFREALKPVTLWLTTKYTRAGRGGTGAAKTGGNYASSLVAQQEAVANGCEQVVFLDGAAGRYVEELGGMNIYFVHDDGRLVTPSRGTILEGITGAALRDIAADLGHEVEERRVSIDEWRTGVAAGTITEVFACGTGAVVTPIGELRWHGGSLESPRRSDVTRKLRSALLDIQYGRVPDRYGWMHRIV